MALPFSVSRYFKPVLFILSLGPTVWLLWLAVHGGLGANPIEKIIRSTGIWGLNFLLITLAVTPVKRLTGWTWVFKQRRMLGMFSFFYATLHLLAYVVLDQFFDWQAIVEDVVLHKRIAVGFASYILLVPLAATSTDGMLKRLGARRWYALHKLTYAACFGSVIHYLWLVKQDMRSPVIYAVIFTLLILYRVLHGFRKVT